MTRAHAAELAQEDDGDADVAPADDHHDDDDDDGGLDFHVPQIEEANFGENDAQEGGDNHGRWNISLLLPRFSQVAQPMLFKWARQLRQS